MKYSGTIVGFGSNYGSIYNIVNDDSKCYAWKANIYAEIKDSMLNITFNWNGELYDIRLSLLKATYYTGKLFVNRELSGQAFFWCYENNEGLLLKGDFIEDETTFECFVELKPKEITVR